MLALSLHSLLQKKVLLSSALVAKLVDAADSKSAVRKYVPVRVRPRALQIFTEASLLVKASFFYVHIRLIVVI
jgi:hypothetical protein